jgi:rRNA maturation endonuclease Nob1
MSDSDNYLYICPGCSVVTYEVVTPCPTCGSLDERLSLAFEILDGVTA